MSIPRTSSTLLAILERLVTFRFPVRSIFLAVISSTVTGSLRPRHHHRRVRQPRGKRKHHLDLTPLLSAGTLAANPFFSCWKEHVHGKNVRHPDPPRGSAAQGSHYR